MSVRVVEGVVVGTAVRVVVAVFDAEDVTVLVSVESAVIDAVTVGLMVWDAEDVWVATAVLVCDPVVVPVLGAVTEVEAVTVGVPVRVGVIV